MLKGLRARIARGIKFLDREYGRSWRRKVDPETLALQNGSACMLGQVEDSFEHALDVLGIDGAKAASMGFNLTEYEREKFHIDERDTAYAELTEAWRKVLKRGR